MEAPVAKVLVVDDDPLILKMINAFLTSKGYMCFLASNPDEALNIVHQNHIDIAIVDVILGEKSGIDLIQILRKSYPKLPCIVITGFEDEKTARLALDVGAYGYLSKPFSLLELLVNIEGNIRRRRLEDLRDNYEDNLQKTISEKTEGLRTSLDLQHKIIEGIVKAIGEVVEVRDPYTAGHQRRVASLAMSIAQVLGLPQETINAVYLSALLHDIGKIAVPAEILTKPSKLDAIEFELVKRHPRVAFKILENIPFPFPIHEIAYQHHERLDGSGYPEGLKGDKIRLEARILAVSDVVEAMMSHRPYRPALGKEAALEEICRNAGKLYDPIVTSACVEAFKSRGFEFRLIEPSWKYWEDNKSEKQSKLSEPCSERL
ncbi:MAG: HD domain-containing phosphohydrolase [Thermodesulforhabdaceae bacterium]